MEALLSGTIPIQSDTACLPESLVEICPGNFLETESWNLVGEILVALEADPGRVEELSTQFIDWARMNNVDLEGFQSEVAKAYGIFSR
jgi:hypothetical protein